MLEEAFKEIGLTDRGWQTFAGELKQMGKDPAKMSVNPETLEHIKKLYKSQVPGKTEVGPVLHAWDKFNSLVKRLLTAWPAKHARDAMSQTYSNVVVAGAGTPSGFRKAMRLMGGPIGDEDRALFNELTVQGVFRKHQSLASEAIRSGSEMLSTGETPWSVATRDLREAARGVRERPVSSFLKPDAKNLFGGSEGLIPLTSASSNDVIDNFMRAWHYISRKEQGYTPTAARNSVVKHLYDFQDLNDLEKRVFRRVVPFYSWIRKNLPHQLELVLNEPGGRTAQSIRAYNVAIRDAEANDEWIPNYVRQSGGVPMGVDDEGVHQFLTGLPFPWAQELNMLQFPGRLNSIPYAGRRTAGNMLATVNPMLTLPIEQMTGEQLWSGRPIKYLQGLTAPMFGEMGMGSIGQLVDQTIMHSPVTRHVTTTRKLLDPRKDVWAKVMNLGLGIGTTSVSPEDVPKWQMVDLLDATKQIARDNPHIKVHEQPYVRPEDIENISEESQRQMAALLLARQQFDKLKRDADKKKVKVRAGR